MITVTTIPLPKKDVQKESLLSKEYETEVPKKDTLQCTSIRSFTF